MTAPRGTGTAEHLQFEPARAHEYRLRVISGQPHAPKGQTTVELDGRGAFRAEQTPQLSGKQAVRETPSPLRINGEVGPDQAHKLLYQASLLSGNRPFPARRGIPGEAIIEYRFERQQGESIQSRMWIGEAQKDVAFAPILRQLREWLKRFSGDEMYL